MKHNLAVLEKEIFEVDEVSFDSLALKIFQFQYDTNKVYRTFCDLIKRTQPKTAQEIPFLPISFFKTHKVVCEGFEIVKHFKSSGTTGSVRSVHHIKDLNLYETSFRKTYARFLGDCSEQVVLALLPNYLEQGESSLLYMIDALIKDSACKHSGYFLNNLDELSDHISEIKKRYPNKQIVIFGVSYALLDLADLKPDLKGSVIIETGGMKGRRKEMTKEELHETLSKAFNVKVISSEYGMTELLSQGYSLENQVFYTPNWMKFYIRDINDAFHYLPSSKTGGVNVIDLANLYSCSFISTQDLGKISDDGIKILGRFDNSDIRGCNLLVN